MFTTFDKAIASSITTGMMSLVAMGGVKPDMTVEQIVTVVVGMVLSWIATYFATNKKR